MAVTQKKAQEFLVYRGRPLLRQDAELYYGDMRDPYIVMLRILETKKEGEFTVASRVAVSLLRTASDIDPLERIVKHREKPGLYDALYIGAVWLERALASDKATDKE